MKIIRYPSKSEWQSICERPHIDVSQLNATVSTVLADIRKRGDEAIMEYEEKFDHVKLQQLKVTDEEIDEAMHNISPALADAITLAHHNIHAFHAAQQFDGCRVETMPGVTCWQKSIAIEKVGLYIPGGTAPLFSTVLMLATPARIAGCQEIILCTPPSKEGKINPAILVAARTAGVNKIFKAGGVQAIGAMAYGTASVPKVFKIFGPGNQYVMAAKQQVSLHDVAIDMPAGPSEVCVIADGSANACYIAADLLSQAEHGADSQVLLISINEQLLEKVQNEIIRQLELLPRKELAQKSLENSRLVLVHDYDEAMELSNTYAPEHLIIQTDNSADMADKVTNAGSVFLGKYACESAGDYASGTNHTLPTHGYATAYSGVNLDSYCRKVTFQHLTAQGVCNIGRAVELMAAAENLDAHKNAMTVRLHDVERDRTVMRQLHNPTDRKK